MGLKMYINSPDDPANRASYDTAAFYVADALADLPASGPRAGDFAVVLDGLKLRIFDGAAWQPPSVL